MTPNSGRSCHIQVTLRATTEGLLLQVAGRRWACQAVSITTTIRCGHVAGSESSYCLVEYLRVYSATRRSGESIPDC